MPQGSPQHIGRSALEQNKASQPVGKIVLFGLIAFILQVVLSPNIAIGGISPNFFMVMLIPTCLISSQRTCIIAGFVFGLLFDFLGAGPVGAMALVLAASGYILSSMLQTITPDRFVTWMIVAAVFTLVANLVFLIIVAIMGYEQSFFASIVFRVIPWTVYTLVAFAIAWPIYRRIARVGRGLIDSRVSL